MAGERQHYNVTLAALTLAGGAFSLQQTMVVPALPTFQRDLHTTTTWATWVLTVFLLVASVATPLIGKLGDQYGKERMLAISLTIFLAGCVGCAGAWNIWSLIAFRAISGAGAAVFPLSFGIIRDEFPAEKVGVAIGLVSAVFGVGGGFGVVIGGLITDNLSWRWLFVVGSVGIAVALVMVVRFVPESPLKTPSRVDVPGALLLSGGLIALLVALTEGESWGWGSGLTTGLIVASLVLFVAWVRVELRVPEPLVDMHVFAQRPVLLTNLTALISGFAMFGTFVLIPNFVEMPHGLGATASRVIDYGFDASGTKAGLYLLPSSIVLLAAGPVAGIVGRKIGMKWPLAAGMVCVALSSGSFAVFHDHPWQIVLPMPLFGIGFGFAYAAMATLITQAVRPTETGIATGMNTVMRTVGGVIGGQMGAVLLSAYTIGRTGYPSVTGYEIAFGLAAGSSVVAAVLATFVTPSRRVRRRREVALAGAGRN